jgi:hypothetical protein
MQTPPVQTEPTPHSILFSHWPLSHVCVVLPMQFRSPGPQTPVHTPAMHVVLGLHAMGGPHVGGPNGLVEHTATLFPSHTRLPGEQKLTTVPELDTVTEPNSPAVASTPDETPLSTPALTMEPETTEPLALKPEATARVPELTPTETPLGMVVPLVTTEPLDVTSVPEPDPLPLPERPKDSRLVRAPHPVGKSSSDAPIAARTFDIFPSWTTAAK